VDTRLQLAIERVLRDYPEARSHPLKDHPLARFIRRDLPALVQERLPQRADGGSYLTSSTKFIGSWAYVPWFSILDPRITESNQSGIYVVCAFSEGGESLVLAVGEGVTTSTKSMLDKDRERILRVAQIPPDFKTGPAPKGTLGKSDTAREYERALHFYRQYSRGSVPRDDEIFRDIGLALKFIDQVFHSADFGSLSFNASVSSALHTSLKGIELTPLDIQEAFHEATQEDWQGLSGIEPYWKLEIDGVRKPLKAVVRKSLGVGVEVDFTTQEAARVARNLGFAVFNEREEEPNEAVSLSPRMWAFAPGKQAEGWNDAVKNGEMAIGWDALGDLRSFKSSEAIAVALKENYGGESEPTNNARCNWEFAHVLKPGDLVYARRGVRELIGIGRISGDYNFEDSRDAYKHMRPVKWLVVGSWQLPEGDRFALKTLTDISRHTDLVARLNALAGFDEDISEAEGDSSSSAEVASAPEFTLQALCEQTGFELNWVQSVSATLKRKMHLVLQGPPGTGKTFFAQGLAKAVISGTRGCIQTVQFHPSYSYEDFIQGIRPVARAGGLAFELTAGHFLRFCERARSIEPAPAVLIIDEFNRANLSRVFGELMYLLEYRDAKVQLASGGHEFSIPKNVLVIGTMNTADRSIALVDHALRRRFSFVHMGPAYEALAAKVSSEGLDGESLVAALRAVNQAIGDSNYEVGTAFFLKDGARLRVVLRQIWEQEIEPYLEEHLFDQRAKVEALRFRSLIKSTLKPWVE
jgi:hypothetical protein